MTGGGLGRVVVWYSRRTVYIILPYIYNNKQKVGCCYCRGKEKACLWVWTFYCMYCMYLYCIVPNLFSSPFLFVSHISYLKLSLTIRKI